LTASSHVKLLVPARWRIPAADSGFRTERPTRIELHALVLSGHLDLHEAQPEIAENWA